MSQPPAVSIVVPTCGRATSMRRLMRALAAQHGATPFEVLVIADGTTAADSGVGDPRVWPFSVRLIEQPRAGAAVARNSGADRALSDLLLFLDDDVEPAPGVVEAHRQFHAAGEGRIGIGGLTPEPSEGGFIGSALAGWWETMCDGLTDPRHRYTFRDLLTGHCSIARSTFIGIGGFDASLRCHEDFEFGYRALEAGFDIRYVAAAEARHHDASTLDKILRRKWDEGIADVTLARMHPRLLRALPLGRPLAAGRRAAVVQRMALESAAGHRLLPPALRAAMSLFERLGMRDKWRDALERSMDYWYWRGVAHAAGGASQARATRESTDAAMEPPLQIDLACGLDAVERQIDVVRPRGLRVTLGSEPVGVLADDPGAERLRGAHLRPLLLKHMLQPFARAAARAGALPDAFVPLVNTASDAGSPSTPLPADCAA